MGAGGFGAYNACMNGTIQSSAGYALYDAYPTDGQSGNGGVKFRSYDECRSATRRSPTPTASTLRPARPKIAGLGNQVKSSKVPDLASTTINSCIESNQVGTLYHQNWAVYAKRVACPDNLTRVNRVQAGRRSRAGQGRRQSDHCGSGQGRRIPQRLPHHHDARLLQASLRLGGKGGRLRGHGRRSISQFTNLYTCDAK